MCKLPSASKILLILAVIIAVIGVVLATRPGRRWTRKQLIPGVRSAAGSLRQAAASPVKLGLLFGGSALITLAYIAGLAASVQAFGGGPGLVVLGAVYLAAAALAAAAPTPGGLGAIEAALVAGLTGVGMQARPAVSAVLLYRLATYWLPVLPGWLCWWSCSTGDTCDRRPAAGPARTSAGAGRARRPSPPVRRRPARRSGIPGSGTCGATFSSRPARNVMRAAPERRTVAYVACLALAVVCCACACGSAAADHADGAAPHGAVITVGSFDFPESVLLAGIYAGALTAQGFPVRVLPDLGARELVDPALMSGLVQVVPEYSGSALEFVSLGRQPATSDVTVTGRALAGWVAGRGLVAGRPSAAQDGNVIVVTAATAARYDLRSVADLARVAPRLAFGGPPECPEEVYCLLGLKSRTVLIAVASSWLRAHGLISAGVTHVG